MAIKSKRVIEVTALSAVLALSGVPAAYADDLENQVGFKLNSSDKHLLLHQDEAGNYISENRGVIERTAHSNASEQGRASRSAGANNGGGKGGKKK